jgi:putative ABC transport system substrate-binding protein
MTSLSRRDLLCTSARLSGLGLMGAGLSILGGCQFLNRPAPSTPSAPRRIGYLNAGTRASNQVYTAAFRDQLRQLGWVEGDNLVVEWRFAEGRPELVPEMAADLVRLPVEVLVAAGAAAVLPALQLTSAIPIVTAAGDPTISELVQNLAHPVGNVTGTSDATTTLMVKSVELLHTVLPHTSRLAILADSTLPAYLDVPPAVQAAERIGLHVQELDVRTVEDVDRAFSAAQSFGADALLIPANQPYHAGIYPRITEVAAQTHLPVMYQDHLVVTEEGGLMEFTWDRVTMWRQDAEYVDRLLRGASPGDLPVQEPRVWEFLVNVKAANALGLTIPPDAAAQVTQWIQ